MGIHLPFVGYARAWGAETVKFDRERGSNPEHIGRVEAVFAALRRVPPSYFKGSLVNRPDLPTVKDFSEVIFEAETSRPQLELFKQRPGPKTLVIPTKQDLFSRTTMEDLSNEEMDVANDVAEIAFYGFIPIICLDDEKFPISPATIRRADRDIVMLIMDNQNRFRNILDNRLEQLKRLKTLASSKQVR